jgi:HlyD family secretion protein
MNTRACLAMTLLLALWIAAFPGNQAATLSAEAPGGTTLREAGALESADVPEISCQVEGGAVIRRIVPEGSTVKNGEILVEFDDSLLRDKLSRQRAALAQAESGLRQAEVTLAALREGLEGQIAVAEAALKVAELDRNQYLAEGGEFQVQMITLESRIKVAENRREILQAAIAQAEEAAKSGLANKAEADKLRLAALEAEAELAIARASKGLLAKHTREHRTAVLDLAVLQAKVALAQAKTQLKAGVEKAEAESQARKLTLQSEKERLERIERQIGACRVVAPRDGIVVYASGGPQRRGQRPAIAEGAVVREGQPLLVIPDMSRLQVRIRVDDSRVAHIRKGQPATVRFDAFPDREFQAKVTAVSESPEPASRLSGVKRYTVCVAVENPSPELRPGMTAIVEIDVAKSSE